MKEKFCDATFSRIFDLGKVTSDDYEFYLCGTGRYEFLQKNEVAINQHQFNVKFCSFEQLTTSETEIKLYIPEMPL